MWDIYGLSTSTICWLGEHPELLAAFRIAEIGLPFFMPDNFRDLEDESQLVEAGVNIATMARFGGDPDSDCWKTRRDNEGHDELSSEDVDPDFHFFWPRFFVEPHESLATGRRRPQDASRRRAVC